MVVVTYWGGLVKDASNSSALSVVVFAIEGQLYALHLATVERVLPFAELTLLPKAPAITLGVLNLHGSVIPVLDIRRRLHFPPRGYALTAHLLVARTTRRILALPVDEVQGVREVTSEAVTSPEDLLPGIGHVAGIVALPDGLLLIHDLETFLSLDEERCLTAALEEMQQ